MTALLIQYDWILRLLLVLTSVYYFRPVRIYRNTHHSSIPTIYIEIASHPLLICCLIFALCLFV